MAGGIMKKRLALMLMGWLVGVAGVVAAEERPVAETVPAPLKPWVDWARFDPPAPECPKLPGEASPAPCVWPTALELQLAARGGRFSLTVDAQSEGVVPLPGDSEAWPRDLRLDGEPVPVVPVEDRPAVRVAAGRHVLTGSFDWPQLPLSLALPAQLGRLAAVVEGQAFTGQPDATGRLWLRERQEGQGAVDALSLRVFRSFVDEVPMRSTVRYELAVSGQPREIRLPLAVLDGFVPLSVEGDLPARIDADGSLMVQARPGSWAVVATSRKMSPTDALQLPAAATAQEVWSFAPRNEVRVVTLQGPPAVDPKALGVPEAWTSFPSFVLQPGETLRIDQRQRGDAAGSADRLSLKRTLWLDFDGGGYSVQDHITGSLGRNWRFDLPEAFALGRVSVNGADQPVTRSPAGRGVELRDAALTLEADSRIESQAGQIPASGWSAPVHAWSAELNLPPGWRLLHVSGADSVHGAWLAAWTLWDIFGVLLIAAVSFRVVGPLAAAALLGGLVLTWHAALAPKFLWLALVVFRAIAAALPDQSRLRGWAQRGGLVSAILIVALLLPFAVSQVRQAMYPALDMYYSEASARREAMPQAPAASAPAELQDGSAPSRRLRKEAAEAVARLDSGGGSSGAEYRTIDPSVKVQTGPGIPSWRWTVVSLASQGPVGPERALTLTLLPPAGSALWSVLSIVLLGVALWRCRPFDLGVVGQRLRGVLGARAAAVLLALGLAGMMPDAAQAQAEFPSEALLKALRERLLAPPKAPACMPRCADLAGLHVKASGRAVTLELEVHAQAPTPVALPSPGAGIRPSSVLLDGKTPALFRDGAGRVWTMVPAGVSRVVMIVPAHLDDLPLHLPMPPRRFSSELDRWSLAGLDAGGLPSATLTLSRVRDATAQEAGRAFAGGTELPPLVEVERQLHLDRTWTVTTSVRRHGQSALQAGVRIPLLAGEAVTDPGVSVEGGEAAFDLAPGTARRFTSVLEPASRLVLPSSTHPGQIERWSITASALWHVESSGFAPTQWTDGRQWQPRWQPWPGEAIELALSRPEVIEGPTLTVDDVRLTATVGQHASDASAHLRLRSSTGGNHVVRLPEGAELAAVHIDGQLQPLRADDKGLALPITPGAHAVQIDWRDPGAVAWRYRAPQLDLGAPAVNASVSLTVPRDRVVLFATGPLVGPAVLLWGVLVVVVALAPVFARVLPTPLGIASWILLGVGLVQASVGSVLLVVGWFVLLAVRRRYAAASPWRFNAVQLMLLLLTLMAAGALFDTLRQGLLGYPEMLIAGNGSSAFQLNWYLDRTPATTPQAEFYSIPVFAYRLLMLAWALWLALAVTRWAKWAWECFSAGGSYWKPLSLPRMGKPKEIEVPIGEPAPERTP